MADRRATILSEQRAEAGRKSRFLQKLDAASQTSFSSTNFSTNKGQESNAASHMGLADGLTGGLQAAPIAMRAKSVGEI